MAFGLNNWLLLVHTLVQIKNGFCQDQKSSQSGQFGRDNGCPGDLKKKSDTCQCDKVRIRCINAQFIDTDAFLLASDAHFFYLREVTFHGNNFQELPKSLFGPSVVHPKLDTLNLSASYIVHVNASALTGMPELRTLDLSHNELKFRDQDVDFLVLVPKLEKLHLRKAFFMPGREQPRVEQKAPVRPELEILEKMFRVARLTRLRYLDLSWNFVEGLPYNFVCPVPGLKHLDLSNNYLKTLNLNTACLKGLSSLDLTANSFQFLDLNFLKTAVGLPQYSLLMRQNDFYCDCKSKTYVTWVQQHTKIKDRDMLICKKASPTKFRNALLLNVTVKQLDCSVVLDNGVAGLTSVCFWLILTLLYSRLF